MKKIFVICSKAVYKDIPQIKEKLEENGWNVFLPHTYQNPNAENEWSAIDSHLLIKDSPNLFFIQLCNRSDTKEIL